MIDEPMPVPTIERTNTDGWTVVEEPFDPSTVRATETAFTIGNGRFSTRGSFGERHPGDQPATLMHGIWGPHPIAVSELANLPDWTRMEIVVDGETFGLEHGTILDHRRTLDLRSGLLRREVTWRTPRLATVRLEMDRFASLAQPDVAAVRLRVTAVDHTIGVEVRAALSAHAPNSGGFSHLDWADQRVDGPIASIAVAIRDTPHRVALATRLAASRADAELIGADLPSHPVTTARWRAEPGDTTSVEKIVVLTSSRQADDPYRAATARLDELRDDTFDSLLAESAAAWGRAWERSDIVIEGDPEAQLATRFSIYHLLIAAPRDDEQVSIGARTLSGFGYYGHVFWDTETFMLPFFTHVHPDIARNLLSYRYHRLPGAQRKAGAEGFDGAQFPWESAETGDEVTPTWVPNAADPSRLVRIWTGDLEIHVSAVIAHAVMQFWRATGDDAFMIERGAEVILESARFWASRAEWNEAAGPYELRDVLGPDEYHEHVDNNAFTNHLAAWHLRTAADLVGWLRDADAGAAVRLGAEPDLAARFRHVADRFHLLRDPDTGLIEQFEGYFALQDVPLAEYEGRTRSMQAILGIEGVADTQIIKQPDVLMLAYLLPDLLTPRELRANFAYYNPRTDHEYGSSLGPAVQSIMALRMGDAEEAYTHFMRAARADLADVRGNAGDGIHAASAGGLWQALVFGFAGVRLDGDQVLAEPRLPRNWTRLAFHLVHRGRTFKVDIRRAEGAPAAEPTIRGLIFDLDGVITDTAELHYQAWQRLADDEGLPFDRQANEALRGISRRESLHRVLAGRTISDEEERALMERKNGYYLELLRTMTPDRVLPGALELLEEARTRGLRIALASASKNAREVLDRLGIADRFDAVCDGYSVEAAKPAPDLFNAAAEALRVPASACVVFEDATDGVAAAHAAGMAAVGIGPSERVGAAEMVLDGLEDADLDAIIGLRSGLEVEIRDAA